MSIGTLAPPPLPADVPVVAPPSEFEGFIDQRLHQTRRQVKIVDVAGGLATLALGALLFLFAAALADHWLIVGGLGPWWRWLLWLAFVGGAGTYFALRLLPPLMHRVNPVYAASTIEKSQPSLRNSLINFLLLRGRREVAPPVFRALEQRAAADLSHVRIDTAVDRTHLIRLCAALAVVLAAFSLYLVFSPKNPLRSAERVLLPWSNLTAPTRVTIDEVRPGDAAAFYGDFITVSAEVAGLHEDEKPVLIYSTGDGQSVDQAMPMTAAAGHRYECRLPPDKFGLQQDYKYHLAAGDCRTPAYRIEVQNAPAIAVDKVVYHYPDYTGLPDQTLDNRQDLQALEGTEVTLHATANAEIKPGSAEIDLGCTGRPGVRMSSDGVRATGSFKLRFGADDNNAPEFDCYQLRFADLQGHENPRPDRHTINVVRDFPPDVRVLEPREERVQVAENGRLTIRIHAADPDFALRRVVLRAVRKDDRSLSIPPLLEKLRPEKGVQGPFQADYVFQPAKFGLKAGDEVQYWAVAEDNKEIGGEPAPTAPRPRNAGSSSKAPRPKIGSNSSRRERREPPPINPKNRRLPRIGRSNGTTPTGRSRISRRKIPRRNSNHRTSQNLPRQTRTRTAKIKPLAKSKKANNPRVNNKALITPPTTNRAATSKTVPSRPRTSRAKENRATEIRPNNKRVKENRTAENRAGKIKAGNPKARSPPASPIGDSIPRPSRATPCRRS